MTASSALEWAVRLVCVARLVTVTEFLLRWHQFGSGGLLNFAISQPIQQPKKIIIRRISGLADEMNKRFFPLVIGLDSLCSATLLVRPGLAVVIAVAAVTQMLIMKRNEIAIEGSDQMILIVLLAAALGRVAGDGVTTCAACYFLAAQLCLAYFSAGAYKAGSRQWISGEALTIVVSTTVFGWPRLGHLLAKRPYISLIATWALLTWECSFPAVPLAPHPVLLVFLGVGLAFHVSCGLIMGLTNFTLAFGSTYPSLIYVNHVVSEYVGAKLAWPILTGLLLAFMCFLATHAMRDTRSQEKHKISELAAVRVLKHNGT